MSGASSGERSAVPAGALRIGLAGLGTVGGAVARAIRDENAILAAKAGRPISLVGVSVRDRARKRDCDIADVPIYDEPTALASSPDIDVFVELIGGAEGAAKDSVLAALAHGRDVVTANKALLAAHGNELGREAERTGAVLAFEAAVAGGIPVVRSLRDALSGNRVRRLYGILNGTCNYILTRMEEEGLDFASCLADAQRLGYAEADPSFDIDGHDTAHKLAILTSLAFGTRLAPDAIFVEGIRGIDAKDVAAAEELGYRIRLLGVADRTETGIECRVHPTMVPRQSDAARIRGVTNAVAIDAEPVGTIVLSGPGAGGGATASAVLGDIIDIARGIRVPPFGRPASAMIEHKQAQMRAHSGGYYLRLDVRDRPGAFARIAQRMADAGISLASIVQHGAGEGARGLDAPSSPIEATQGVVIITHDTTEAAMRSAIGAIEADGEVTGQAQMIRIERL